MMNADMILIPRERFEELIKTEAKVQFIVDYVRKEVVTADDILYYLGVKDKEKSDEIS